MNAYEVVQFLNHRYGEIAFLFETDKKFIIYTNKSIWQIFKDDKKKLNIYALYHSNRQNEYYHLQLYGHSVPFLVYCAITHDIDSIFTTPITWQEFQKQYEFYCYGLELWNNVLKFEEECAIEEFMKGANEL